MYFLKAISSFLFLIILIDGFTEASESRENSLKKVVEKTNELKQEVEKALRNFKENCNSNNSASRDDEFEKVVSDFLKENFTIQRESHLLQTQFTSHIDQKRENVSAAANSDESFIAKVKHKLSSLFHHNKTNVHPEARLKRCLTTNLFKSYLNGTQITFEEESFNMTSADAEEFERFLQNFIDCLKNEGRESHKESDYSEEDKTSTEAMTTGKLLKVLTFHNFQES